MHVSSTMKKFGRRLFLHLFPVLCGIGAMAHAATEPKVEMTVQLPPFIIEQPAGPKWRYTRIPRFEILSRCHDLTTEQLALAFHRANQLLGLVLPERFQLALDVPQALIFYDEKLWPVAEQQAVAAMLRAHPPARPDGVPTPGAPPRVRLEPITGSKLLGTGQSPEATVSDSFFSNLMLTDADSITTFALVSKSNIDPQRSYLTSGYVRNLLQNRAPALPDWFTAGFMRLYDRMNFEGNTVSVKPLRWDEVLVVGRPEVAPDDRDGATDIVRIAARQETQRLKARRALELGQQPLQLNPGDQGRRDMPAANRKEPAPEPDLRLPLAGLIDGVVPTGDLGPWLEQAELLVSWGLDPANGRAEAFWQWIDRVGTEPATEALFQECLGLDYAAATRSIIAYSTNHRGIRWVLPEALVRPPADPVLDATPLQIARLKGEWERLEARYVRKNQPDLEEHYVTLARRTLRRAYDRGDRDPRLLASLGLLELDAGKKAEAVALLEQAVQAGVIRPRAYYELARLRYDHVFGRSTRNDGKYSAEQVASVVEPLLAGMKQSPPLDAAYELLAHISTQSVMPPSAEVLVVLERGARLFPQKRDRLLELAIRSESGPK
jgi:hypothetical protein